MKRKKRVAGRIKYLQYSLRHIQEEDDNDTMNVNLVLDTQSDQGNTCKSDWIIDSGVTNHMIGNFKCFMSIS